MWSIEQLARRHDRRTFDCGNEALNQFLRTQARQQQAKNVNRTFVAVRAGDSSKKVSGFYTLSAASITFDNLQPSDKKKLPRYPIPVARLGRLATDLSQRGHGLGGLLLKHALSRAAAVAQDDLGIFAVVVDAKDVRAAEFYQHYGFISFVDTPSGLYLPIKTILAAMS